MSPTETNKDELLRDMNFEASFAEIQADAAATNLKNGFTKPDNDIDDLENFMRVEYPGLMRERFGGLFEDLRRARAGLKFALIVGEIGEALEAVRKNLGADDHIPEFSAEEAECADAVLRLMNYATDRKLRLAEAITAKNRFNRNRADHVDRSGPHGKTF